VFVFPDGCPAPSVAQVRSHVDGRLAGFKVPRRVATALTIPRTPATGQIQRGRLRDLLTDPPGGAARPAV
jgi:fatty-acyl-CoA synthase